MPTITVDQFTGSSFAATTFPTHLTNVIPLAASSTQITFASTTFPSLVTVVNGSGFTFAPDGEPTGGTVTSIDFFNSGTLVATMSGFSFALVDFAAAIDDPAALDALFAPFDFVMDASTVSTAETTFDDTSFALGDTAIAGAGGSYMELGEYADTYVAGTGFDQISFANESGAFGVVANLSTGVISDTYGNAETLSGQFESLRGSANADYLTGDGIRQHIRGLAGNDTLDGSGGDDLVRYDRDVNYGGSASVMVDLANGTAIDGFGDTDILLNFRDARGTIYDDTLIGDSQDNRLHGDAGDDIFVGNAGDDTLYGGIGDDQASYANASSAVRVYLENSGNDIGAGQGRDVFDGIDGIEGSAFNDRLNGNAANNAIFGGNGNDTIKGEGGNDRLEGQGGNDKIRGENEMDTISGGQGNDVLVGFSGDDDMYGDAGNDTVFGGRDNDFLDGDIGEDVLRGNKGEDTLYGGAGSDRLYGGSQNDLMSGGDGVDYLLGERGNDTLEGGADNDRLTGGVGADVFVMVANGGYDIARDFEDGSDLIDVTAFGLTNISQLTIQDIGSGARIDVAPSVTLLLQGVFESDLDNSDFIF